MSGKEATDSKIEFRGMRKELFFLIIDSIRKQRNKDKAHWDDLCKVYHTDDIPIYDNSLLEGSLFSVLEDCFPAEAYDEIVSFCNDLDFGNASGSRISDVEMLWRKIGSSF